MLNNFEKSMASFSEVTTSVNLQVVYAILCAVTLILEQLGTRAINKCQNQRDNDQH
jgi:hypothetical protein